jgi:hypothetical protein
MQLNVTGKHIDTSPAKNLLVQGEENADIIPIVVPKVYGALNLSTLTWVMRAVSEKNTLVEGTCTATADGDNLNISWVVSAPFTAVDGNIKLELCGTSGTDTIIKLTGDDIYVKPKATGEYTPPTDVFESTLAQMRVILGQVQTLSATTGFKPKAVYATYAALKAAHPTGELGDQYVVGDGTPTATYIYIWDIDANNWVSAGLVAQKGDTGATGAPGGKGDTGDTGPAGAAGHSPVITINATTKHLEVDGVDTGYAVDTVVVSDTSSTTKSQLVADNTEYRFGSLTSLTLTFPTPGATDKFDASVSFTSGATPTAFSGTGPKYKGDNVTNGVFTPVANRRYTIMFGFDGVNINAYVSGVA